ncbi:MAG: exodeoxyribonuclease VII small subunit [Burkholderiaceae bacterium]
MSGSTKLIKKKNKKKVSRDISFEEHVSYAEKILIDLENNDLTLEEAVENYTEALARINLAKKILEDTQNKVEIIERRVLDGMSAKKTKTK